MFSMKIRALLSLLLSFGISHIGGQRAEQYSHEGFLFSVEVSLSETDAPAILGIREGQTVAEAATSFCQDRGFNDSMTTAIMPRLVQVLQDGINQVVQSSRTGPNTSVGKSQEEKDGSPSADGLDGPLITLDVSVEGGPMRTLEFHGGQDPREVAKTFCAEHLRSTDLEDVARCCDTLTASIAQRRETALDSPNPEENEQMSRRASTRQEGNNPLTRAGAHRLRIPLNVNGAEVALAVRTDTAPGDIAIEFCQREQFGFVGTALDNCISQVAEVSRRAIRVQYSRESDPPEDKSQPQQQQQQQQQQQLRRRPRRQRPGLYVIKVPVDIAGLTLFAELRENDRPNDSARRFCRLHEARIEAALLGSDTIFPKQDNGYDGEAGKDEGDAGRTGEAAGSERGTLETACTQVVLAAIRSALLDLRNLVSDPSPDLTDINNGTSHSRHGHQEGSDWPHQYHSEGGRRGWHGEHNTTSSSASTSMPASALPQPSVPSSMVDISTQ